MKIREITKVGDPQRIWRVCDGTPKSTTLGGFVFIDTRLMVLGPKGEVLTTIWMEWDLPYNEEFDRVQADGLTVLENYHA